MILSSSDILSVLSRDPILSSLVTLKIVDGRPPLEDGNGVIVYISRYPKTTELEAIWDLWLIDLSNEPIDVVIAQIKKIIPGFRIINDGQIIKAQVTELLSTRTNIKSSSANNPQNILETNILNTVLKKFEDLRQSIEDRMLLVGPGRAGRDGVNGLNGRDGKDGKNGRDLLATNAILDDLKDVSIADAKRGQFLMFDGSSWVARFVPQLIRSGGGGTSTGGTGGGIEEAPIDGNFYVRQDGQWINLIDALSNLGNIDAGNFTTGVADTTSGTSFDAGDFTP